MKMHYCSGLWLLSGNAKHGVQHYDRLLPLTLDMIAGENLRFHSDDPALLERVAALSDERGLACETVELKFEELPGWDKAEALVECCRRMQLDKWAESPERVGEKGINHYRRDLQEGGAETYRKLLAIWISKVDLVSELCTDVPEGDAVAWMDASLTRCNGTRENWKFQDVRPIPGSISHYGSNMRFLGSRLPLSAGFLCGLPQDWAWFAEAFADALGRALQMPYGHDEETIMADCVWRHPDRFTLIGQNYGGSRARFLLRRLLRAVRRQD